jgi:hypothetical protein
LLCLRALPVAAQQHFHPGSTVIDATRTLGRGSAACLLHTGFERSSNGKQRQSCEPRAASDHRATAEKTKRTASGRGPHQRTAAKQEIAKKYSSKKGAEARVPGQTELTGLPTGCSDKQLTPGRYQDCRQSLSKRHLTHHPTPSLQFRARSPSTS